MPFMTWEADMSVGVPSIDAQHQEIITLINEIYEGVKTGTSRDVLKGALEKLLVYTDRHFKYEEKLFAQIGYPEAQSHAQEHQKMIETVRAFQEKATHAHTGLLSLEVMDMIKSWIASHLKGEDKKYMPYFIAHGIQ